MRPKTPKRPRCLWRNALLLLIGLIVVAVCDPVGLLLPVRAEIGAESRSIQNESPTSADLVAPLTLEPRRDAPAVLADDDVCAAIPGEIYGETWLNPPPLNRPAESHPDINLIVRGYGPATGDKGLVFYNGDTDNRAPQLCGLFGDDRTPQITALYSVFDWDWAEDVRGLPLAKPEVTLIGVAARPGEILYVPPAGYTIGEGFDVVVLYASPLRMTLKYTRDDNVVQGYTLHIENMCTEPNLLGVYNNCNNNARGHLPALKAGQAIGRARGGEIGIAIRDNGVFMDPRSNKDWWRGR